MSSSFRAALRREMEAHLGGPPNDPTRCITEKEGDVLEGDRHLSNWKVERVSL